MGQPLPPLLGGWGGFPAAVLALVLSGCGGGGNPFRAVERAIERELPGRIGPAERYEARVSRSGANLLSGRLPWVEIYGRNVRAANALAIADLRVRLEGVRFDRKARAIASVADSRFTAEIGADAVTAFVRARSPGLHDLRVQFREEDVTVYATPALLGIGIPMQIEGKPVLRDEARIDFAASRVSVLRVGLPELAVRRLEEAVNPIVDLQALRIPARARDARITGGRLHVSGTADFERQPVAGGR